MPMGFSFVLYRSILYNAAEKIEGDARRPSFACTHLSGVDPEFDDWAEEHFFGLWHIYFTYLFLLSTQV